jgi:nucleoid-associated protein YgaU
MNACNWTVLSLACVMVGLNGCRMVRSGQDPALRPDVLQRESAATDAVDTRVPVAVDPPRSVIIRPTEPAAVTTTTPPTDYVTAPAAISDPDPSTLPQNHTIARGDTLWSIAVRYYGEGKLYPKILAANPGLKENALPLGKTILIPAK